MFSIDLSRVKGDTTNMLLSNISEQLAELLQKPQEAKEVKTEVNKDSVKCPKCGKEFEKYRQLQGHLIKCKGA
jgi:DNA-directed RNA polymerase subunit M/transcription elongation factor TFIIS